MVQATDTTQLRPRKYGYDNLRCFLIICVVFGHLLEISAPFMGSTLLYRVIYSFHMPAFIFLFGYFAEYRPERIVFYYLIPYIVFQTLYIWFSRTLLHVEIAFQYTTPYWHLWYLLPCIYYQLLIPFFDTDKKKRQSMLLIVTVILALLVGFDDSIGYYASLSRFFVFQPWFLFGLYYRKYELTIKMRSFQTKAIVTVIEVGIIIYSLFFLHSSHTSNSMLYGSYSYASIGYSVISRFVLMIIAFSWIGIFLKIFTRYIDIRIPLFTTIGQNTFPIFLLHGFVVKIIAQYVPFICSRPFLIILVTCATILMLGNRYLGRCFKWLFHDFWLGKKWF